MDDRRLVLLRHGRSRADDEQVHEGRYDSPLTEVGREQARATARHWSEAGRRFDRIVASSLVRARETAEIIGAVLGLEVAIEPRWMEHDNGPLAGLPFAEAERRFPTPAFRSRWAPLTPDGGESVEGLHRRAGEALEALRVGPGEHVLVVAHGGILNAALRVLLGASPHTHFAFGDNGCAELSLRDGSDDIRLVSFVTSVPGRGGG